MKFTVKDGKIYGDGKSMFALVRAVWGNDPGIPTWADLDAARDALAAQLTSTTELLEAVKRFLKCHDQDRDYSDMSWDAARAAIAQAEGSATP